MPNRFILSIIIVHLDQINELMKTLKSVYQTKSLEVEVIVQDGGTENIRQALNKRKFKNFKLISEPDDGIYNAMNKGVNISNGMFVLFLNAGDTFYDTTSLNYLLQKIRENCNKSKIWDILVWKVSVDKNKNKIKFGILDPNTVESVFSHQGVIVKKYLLEKYKFDEKYSLSADYKFFKQCLYDRRNFSYHRKILTNVTSGGISDINRMKVIKEFWLINSEFGLSFKTLLKFSFVYLMTLLSIGKQLCKKL